ncbi:UNVERIFIED_CONTAM: hypothetical protein Slati_4168400 [Sesamum latifolium]|uniref:Uncharacterized protein n=1 Tax=Sesamum latifolium TaxID=2727402 RepID=A0AAW2TAI0_9LAMI
MRVERVDGGGSVGDGAGVRRTAAHEREREADGDLMGLRQTAAAGVAADGGA